MWLLSPSCHVYYITVMRQICWIHCPDPQRSWCSRNVTDNAHHDPGRWSACVSKLRVHGRQPVERGTPRLHGQVAVFQLFCRKMPWPGEEVVFPPAGAGPEWNHPIIRLVSGFILAWQAGASLHGNVARRRRRRHHAARLLCGGALRLDVISLF